MDIVTQAQNGLLRIYNLGGPTVMILLLLLIVTTAVTLYNVWQHRAARVQGHPLLQQALDV